MNVRRSLASFLICLFFCFKAVSAGQELIVFIGDSLTEGYGVERTEAFPALIEKRLLAKGKNIKVQNSGISGSTSASAVSRMRWALKTHPHLIVLALGSNDMLRGLSPSELEKNLAAAVEIARHDNVLMILCGTDVPTNYGKKYAEQIHSAFDHIAKKFKLVFVPSILDGVAAHREFNQTDGIHPNAKGHAVIADHLMPAIEKAL